MDSGKDRLAFDNLLKDFEAYSPLVMPGTASELLRQIRIHLERVEPTNQVVNDIITKLSDKASLPANMHVVLDSLRLFLLKDMHFTAAHHMSLFQKLIDRAVDEKSRTLGASLQPEFDDARSSVAKVESSIQQVKDHLDTTNRSMESATRLRRIAYFVFASLAAITSFAAIYSFLRNRDQDMAIQSTRSQLQEQEQTLSTHQQILTPLQSRQSETQSQVKSLQAALQMPKNMEMVAWGTLELQKLDSKIQHKRVELADSFNIKKNEFDYNPDVASIEFALENYDNASSYTIVFDIKNPIRYPALILTHHQNSAGKFTIISRTDGNPVLVPGVPEVFKFYVIKFVDKK